MQRSLSETTQVTVGPSARDDAEARRLKEGGRIDLVLYPFHDAAISAAKQITDLDEEQRQPTTGANRIEFGG